MAASTRAITPSQTGPFTASGVAPATPNASSLQPDANSTIAALRASSKSPSAISPRSSPQPLTGTAALAEQRAEKERKAREEARNISHNPATTALNALLKSESMSRPTDGPVAPAAQMSKPLQQVAKSIVIPENVTSDTMQTSPVSLSSFGSSESTTAPTATANDTTTAPFPLLDPAVAGQERPQENNHAPSQAGLAPPPQENASNRSMTFPGPLPLDGDPRAPQRGMSLPMSGFQNNPKSPSTKRHKCPYCATDFTRHHNLKSHLLTHSQEKPYECPDCHARFRRLHDLKRHTKLHTGERPHICPKCGRRFARGDALARHNKGQGGCAGRRSSLGMDDEMGDGRGEEMDGVEYQHGDRENEDGQDATDRRISEPTRRGSARQDSMAGFQPHGSTYPPVMAVNRNPGNSVRPIYPPTTAGTRDQSMNLSPKPNSLSTAHFASAQPSGVYSHTGMTESPKPISPGQTDHKRLGSTGGPSVPGGRSPNMSQHMNPHSFAQGAGRGASLPPPHGLANAPQLPQLPGLAPSTGTTDPRLAVMQPNASNPGSTSSHGASSGGSMREIMGGSRDNDMWIALRDMERANSQRQAEYEARIAQLERELATVRAQLPANQIQQLQQQSQPPPQPQLASSSQTGSAT
ncbi:hypothetical protein EJ05DRAFT_345027 [Pseudovirgaria hyperparasitica]|uniref:C2H2-type domain-containing protein n=1 Tax=Pseudovirgaria hyperparasitica TaxID=470096 RepID=A0A6A6WE68_9PEZI|nr:uncharacterized protein EJ05DRAFT_345027 [Pseudovirgaria hyperparasitica]KAF2759411.1 hypothetical protein EJ05DRAFT_345027 [Pseudovirgaria hyperparasitica]